MSKIEIHHHYHNYQDGVSPEVNRKLNQILEKLQALTKMERTMITEYQALIDEVTEVKTVAASSAVAINGLVAKFNDMVQSATDLAEVKAASAAMVQDLKDNVVTPLSDAVGTIPV